MVYLNQFLKFKEILIFLIFIGISGYSAHSKDMGVCLLRAKKGTSLQHKINQVAMSQEENEQIQARVRYFNDLKNLWVSIDTYNYKLFWIRKPDSYWLQENCFKYGFITERDYGRRAITRVFSSPSLVVGERQISNTQRISTESPEGDLNTRFGSEDSRIRKDGTPQDDQNREIPRSENSNKKSSSEPPNQEVLIYDSKGKPTSGTIEKLSYESQSPMSRDSDPSYNHMSQTESSRDQRNKSPERERGYSQASSQDVLNREPAPQILLQEDLGSRERGLHQAPSSSFRKARSSSDHRNSNPYPPSDPRDSSGTSVHNPQQNLPASRFIHDGVLNQPDHNHAKTSFHSNPGSGYEEYQNWPKNDGKHRNLDGGSSTSRYNLRAHQNPTSNSHGRYLPQGASHQGPHSERNKSYNRYYRKVEHKNSPRHNLNRVQTQNYSAPPSYIYPRIDPRINHQISPRINHQITPRIAPRITLHNNYYSGKRTMKNISRSGMEASIKNDQEDSEEEFVNREGNRRSSRQEGHEDNRKSNEDDEDDEDEDNDDDDEKDYNNEDHEFYRSGRRSQRGYKKYETYHRVEEDTEKERTTQDKREGKKGQTKKEQDRLSKKQLKIQKKWEKKLSQKERQNKELNKKLKTLKEKKEKSKKDKAKYEVPDYYKDPAIFITLDPFLGYENVNVSESDVTNKFDLFSYGVFIKLGYRFNEYFNIYAKGKYLQFHGISETDGTTLDLISDGEYRVDYNYGGGFEHVASRFLSLAVEYNVFVMHSFETRESNSSRVLTAENEFHSVNLEFVINLISKDNYRVGFSNNLGLGLDSESTNVQMRSHFFIRRTFKRGYYGMHLGFERIQFESGENNENKVVRDRPVFSLNYGFDFF